MRRVFKLFGSQRKAQTTSEYVIILSLVALGSIAVILLFGNTVRGLFGSSTKKMAGQSTDFTSDYAPDEGDVDASVTVEDMGEAVSNQ